MVEFVEYIKYSNDKDNYQYIEIQINKRQFQIRLLNKTIYNTSKTIQYLKWKFTGKFKMIIFDELNYPYLPIKFIWTRFNIKLSTDNKIENPLYFCILFHDRLIIINNIYHYFSELNESINSVINNQDIVEYPFFRNVKDAWSLGNGILIHLMDLSITYIEHPLELMSQNGIKMVKKIWWVSDIEIPLIMIIDNNGIKLYKYKYVNNIFECIFFEDKEYLIKEDKELNSCKIISKDKNIFYLYLTFKQDQEIHIIEIDNINNKSIGYEIQKEYGINGLYSIQVLNLLYKDFDIEDGLIIYNEKSKKLKLYINNIYMNEFKLEINENIDTKDMKQFYYLKNDFIYKQNTPEFIFLDFGIIFNNFKEINNSTGERVFIDILKILKIMLNYYEFIELIKNFYWVISKISRDNLKKYYNVFILVGCLMIKFNIKIFRYPDNPIQFLEDSDELKIIYDTILIFQNNSVFDQQFKLIYYINSLLTGVLLLKEEYLIRFIYSNGKNGEKHIKDLEIIITILERLNNNNYEIKRSFLNFFSLLDIDITFIKLDSNTDHVLNNIFKLYNQRLGLIEWLTDKFYNFKNNENNYKVNVSTPYDLLVLLKDEIISDEIIKKLKNINGVLYCDKSNINNQDTKLLIQTYYYSFEFIQIYMIIKLCISYNDDDICKLIFIKKLMNFCKNLHTKKRKDFNINILIKMFDLNLIYPILIYWEKLSKEWCNISKLNQFKSIEDLQILIKIYKFLNRKDFSKTYESIYNLNNNDELDVGNLKNLIRMKYPNDNRMEQVNKMFNIDIFTDFRIENNIKNDENSDESEDIKEEILLLGQKELIYKNFYNTIAKSYGSIIFSYGMHLNYNSFYEIKDRLKIPKFNFSVKFPTWSSNINLLQLPEDILDIPQFWSGVNMIFKCNGEIIKKENNNILTSEEIKWLIKQIPDSFKFNHSRIFDEYQLTYDNNEFQDNNIRDMPIPLDIERDPILQERFIRIQNRIFNNSESNKQTKDETTDIKYNYNESQYSGIIYGLGLLKKLKGLPITFLYELLSIGNNLLSSSLLLGCCFSYLGQEDPGLTKLLCLHLPTCINYDKIIEFGSNDLGKYDNNISHPGISYCSIIGLGLLYLNKSNRRISKIILSEIQILGTNYCNESVNQKNRTYQKWNGTSIKWFWRPRVRNEMSNYKIPIKNNLNNGSMNFFLDDTLDEDIEKVNFNFGIMCPNIESYLNCCFISLGLVNLNCGDKIESFKNIQDLNIIDKLIEYNFLFFDSSIFLSDSKNIEEEEKKKKYPGNILTTIPSLISWTLIYFYTSNPNAITCINNSINYFVHNDIRKCRNISNESLFYLHTSKWLIYNLKDFKNILESNSLNLINNFDDFLWNQIPLIQTNWLKKNGILRYMEFNIQKFQKSQINNFFELDENEFTLNLSKFKMFFIKNNGIINLIDLLQGLTILGSGFYTLGLKYVSSRNIYIYKLMSYYYCLFKTISKYDIDNDSLYDCTDYGYGNKQYQPLIKHKMKQSKIQWMLEILLMSMCFIMNGNGNIELLREIKSIESNNLNYLNYHSNNNTIYNHWPFISKTHLYFCLGLLFNNGIILTDNGNFNEIKGKCFIFLSTLPLIYGSYGNLHYDDFIGKINESIGSYAISANGPNNLNSNTNNNLNTDIIRKNLCQSEFFNEHYPLILMRGFLILSIDSPKLLVTFSNDNCNKNYNMTISNVKLIKDNITLLTTPCFVDDLNNYKEIIWEKNRLYINHKIKNLKTNVKKLYFNPNNYTNLDFIKIEKTLLESQNYEYDLLNLIGTKILKGIGNNFTLNLIKNILNLTINIGKNKDNHILTFKHIISCFCELENNLILVISNEDFLRKFGDHILNMIDIILLGKNGKNEKLIPFSYMVSWLIDDEMKFSTFLYLYYQALISIQKKNLYAS